MPNDDRNSTTLQTLDSAAEQLRRASGFCSVEDGGAACALVAAAADLTARAREALAAQPSGGPALGGDDADRPTPQADADRAARQSPLA